MVMTPKAGKAREAIPVDTSPQTPAVCAAICAAISYYMPKIAAAPFYEKTSALVFIFFTLIAFVRVLASCPFLFTQNESEGKKVPAAIKKINLFLLAGAVGFFFGAAGRAAVTPIDIALEPGRVTGLSGVLRDDPRAFNDGRGIGSLDLNRAYGEGGVQVSAGGTVPVFFPADAVPRLKEFGRGCEIYVEGRAVSGGSGLSFRAAGVHVTKPASTLEQFRTAFRFGVMEKFGILRGGGEAAPAWSGLASALLLGVRDDLDTDLAVSFREAGCSHVLALSGMHLAILSGIITFVLKKLFGIRIASLLGAFFIVIYIFLAGAQPSLVRAGIMYLLAAAALLGFLKKNVLALLAMAFIAQIFIQSESGGTVSFILSYLALLGILITSETIRELLRGRFPDFVVTPLSASLGAFIATSGVTAFFFGALRPVGIIAGIFIMPLASLFMILAFAFLVLASIAPVLFEAFNVVLSLLYRLLDFFVSLAAKAPAVGASSFWPVVLVSLVIVIALEVLKHIDRRHRRSIAAFD